MKASEILRRAADLIEPEGAWTQGGWWATNDRGEPCYCAEGAIAKAAGVAPREGVKLEATKILRRHILADIPLWNDDPERTQAEVVSALRNAAQQAEGEETNRALSSLPQDKTGA